jgi:hypothetical protein
MEGKIHEKKEGSPSDMMKKSDGNKGKHPDLIYKEGFSPGMIFPP